jgi:hypothetical protein
MGAGILPTTIHNNKLYFLFGKENKYEDSAPGFSDFGGGTDNNESFLSTAVREAGEELTGFLGSSKEVLQMLRKHGTYNIDLTTTGHDTYRMHIFPFKFDPLLPIYYNNNQKFLQKQIPDVIKSTKIFEKEEIRWICVDDISKMRPKFRHYFRKIVDTIYNERNQIRAFIIASTNRKRNATNRKRNTTNRKRNATNRKRKTKSNKYK